MTRGHLLALTITLALLALLPNCNGKPGCGPKRKKMSHKFEYPEVRRDESVSDEFFGTEVKDPYRWLEDAESEETKKFIEEQNAITFPFLEESPIRETIKEEMTKMYNYPKEGLPQKKGDYYIFSKNSGLQDQSVVYKVKSLGDEPEVLLDPNTLSEDGTISLSTRSVSKDGEIMAYGLSQSGSDIFDVYFRNVETGEDIEGEVLKGLRFSSLTWASDGKGIFYTRFQRSGTSAERSGKVDEDHTIFYHRMGQPQSNDVVAVRFPEEPQWVLSHDATEDGKYLLVFASRDTSNDDVYFADLEAQFPDGEVTAELKVEKLVGEFDAPYQYVTSEGSTIVLRTNKDAANYHLITFDLSKPDAKPAVLVAEESSRVLASAECGNGDKLILNYMEDVKTKLQVNDLATGKFLYNLDIEIGTASVSADKDHSEMFIVFTSHIVPRKIYRVDLSADKPSLELLSEAVAPGFNSADYRVDQVFYSSKDGTKVPMYICSHVDTPLDGSSPAFLYGYGGFSIALTPNFQVSQALFMKHFGHVVIANLRGGSEYGESWHQDGMLDKKQNVFDDFHAAAEYLIDNKYTSSSKLSIYGRSNGGLLIGAVANQRPELYGAAIPAVGVMDMLRYFRFTAGYLWIGEYGDPRESEETFNYIYDYSPLHNIKQGDVQYPAIMVVTADTDDRVVPAHSLKYTAELQHVLAKDPKQTNPLLIRVEERAGHGGGKPVSKVIEEYTDIYTFIAKTLNYEFKPRK